MTSKHKISFPLLLHNCDFDTLMDLNVNIWYTGHVTLVKRLFSHKGLRRTAAVEDILSPKSALVSKWLGLLIGLFLFASIPAPLLLFRDNQAFVFPWRFNIKPVDLREDSAVLTPDTISTQSPGYYRRMSWINLRTPVVTGKAWTGLPWIFAF